MIRVTLELVSGNGPGRDRLLGVAHIANTGRASPGAAPGSNKYAYEVSLSKTIPGRMQENWRRGRAGIVDDRLITDLMTGEIAAFDNVKRGAWDLLYLALKAVVGARN